jgi:ABC-type amino acid transport substrate-binding protein
MRDFFKIVALLGIGIRFDPAFAKEEIDLFVEDNSVPPIYFNQQGQFAGSARELLDMFARTQAIAFHYRLLPPKRLRNLSQRNDRSVQCFFPDNPAWSHTPPSPPDLAYSKPVFFVTEGLYVLPTDWNRSRWRPQVIGVVNGWTPVPLLADIRHNKYQVVYAQSLENLFAMLTRHRVDAVYANSAVTGSQFVLDIRLPHFRTDYRLSCRNGHSVLDRFNRFMRQNSHTLDSVVLFY